MGKKTLCVVKDPPAVMLNARHVLDDDDFGIKCDCKRWHHGVVHVAWVRAPRGVVRVGVSLAWRRSEEDVNIADAGPELILRRRGSSKNLMSDVTRRRSID